MPPRRREIPAEGSWRLVDGENDSFDTSIMDSLLGDDFSPPSSAMPSSGLPTQQSFSQSQNNMSFGSQDSIRDFANFQNDEDVILRQPFRPTLPSSAATSMQRTTSYPRPELQLRMPLVEANNLVASEASRTSRAAHDDSEEGSVWDSEREEVQGDTVRDSWHEDLEREYAKLLKEQNEASVNWHRTESSSSKSSLSRRLLRVFRYTAIPITIVLAAYLFHLNGISIQVARDKVQSFSFKSLHDIPSVSNFQIPFFEAETSHRAASSFIDFTGLMEVQSGFESVLDKSAYGLSMPLELKRSDMASRSLRSLLKESEIAAREELILELNGYIERVGRAGSDLQTFYIHIGSTVDSVININRWTLRHINSLSMEPEAPSLPPVIAWAIRPLSLFKPSEQAGNDKALLDKYSEHIILVQDRLEKLLDEGKALSLLLHQGQTYLSAINEQAERLSSAGRAKPDSLLSTIWAYIENLMEEEPNFDEQIAVLKKVDAQYANTISHLVSLIEELKDIQLYLGDLLKRNDDPSTFWGDEPGAQAQTTLSEQYDIIKNALEKLEQARKRAAEGEAEHETQSETDAEMRDDDA